MTAFIVFYATMGVLLGLDAYFTQRDLYYPPLTCAITGVLYAVFWFVLEAKDVGERLWKRFF